MEAIAICLFGMESTVSYELKNLGFEIVRVNDGRVTFKTDSLGIARANICLRCAERVVVKVGDFFADSFEQLFDQIALLPFEKYLNQDSKFHVAKVRSINSRLVSAKDIQLIVKKSIIERLRKKLGADHFPETQGEHRIHIFINKNIVEVSFDTTGAALHKRGYRELSGEAPLRETIAAFMVMGSPWKRGRLLVDPMCGSGTIAIEAALYGANIMPGVNRNFAGESLNFISPKDWVYARKEAIEGESHEEFKIFASDKDPKMIHLAKEAVWHAARAYPHPADRLCRHLCRHAGQQSRAAWRNGQNLSGQHAAIRRIRCACHVSCRSIAHSRQWQRAHH